MPNKNSHAQHQPQRTCVACKARKDQSSLLSFFVLPEGLVFDPSRRVQRRRNYVCPEASCLIGLDKWKKNFQKKRRWPVSPPVFSSVNLDGEGQ